MEPEDNAAAAALQALEAAVEEVRAALSARQPGAAAAPAGRAVGLAVALPDAALAPHLPLLQMLGEVLLMAADAPDLIGAAEGEPAATAATTAAKAALAAFDRLRALLPPEDAAAGPVAAFHRLRALDRLGRDREALAAAEDLAEQSQRAPEIWRNLALLRRAGGDPAGALAALDRAQALAPDSADLALVRAHTLLTRGDWAAGFAAYEARLALPGWRRPGPLPGRPWTGAPLAGAGLFVAAEQGLGDGVQVLRYLPRLKSQCGAGRVVLEAHAPLLPLARRLVVAGAVDAVVPFVPAEDPLPEVQALPWHVWMGSLPLRVAGGDPLASEAVLFPRPKPRAESGRSGGSDAPLRVGLVWRTSGRPELRRDPPLDLLDDALGRVARSVCWVDCQFDPDGSLPRPAVLSSSPSSGAAESMAGVRDLEDTARRLAGLDLLITPDTVTAHLAAALGLPVWVLLGPRPDWRWGAGGETTPWLPSARLFRPPPLAGSMGWASVIAALGAALGSL